jgi:cyclohexadieny/prephenate dehydrogenase
MLFQKVAFIGIGLIGSSLARVMRRDNLAGHLVVCARSQSTLDKALELGLADTITLDPKEAVEDADLIVLCTPLGAYETIAKAMAPQLKKGAIVTDVGSVKEAAIKAVAPHIPEGVHFVPGHPIAGTEHSGVEAGFAELFEGRWCILTPCSETEQAAIDKVSSLWEQAGMMIEVMDAAHHDRVLAVTSHLPHLIAYTIVGTASDLEDDLQKEVVKYSASGFRDFTRIAASDPVMWRDIVLANQEAILDILGRFSEDLTALQRSVRRNEGDALHDIFSRTRDLRRRVIKAKQA